jgi:hypothetical protein
LSGGRPDCNRAQLDIVMADATSFAPVAAAAGVRFGVSRDTAHTHFTIAVPNATAQSLGIPDKPRQDGIWLTNAGTTTAHIMTPGESDD